MKPVRSVASVSVSKTVDGTKKRRAPRAHSRSRKVVVEKVDADVMSTARQVLRKGEKIKIVDAKTIITVYTKG